VAILLKDCVKDYYSILGVHQTASDGEIKRAYRRLAVQYHPDKNADPAAEIFFKEINEAYQVLSDPTERHFYNQRRNNPFGDVVVEETPRHRDPAYRRPRPQYNPSASKESDVQAFLKEYKWYYYWICFAGLAFSLVFYFDAILPETQSTEHIRDVRPVRGRRNSVSHFNAYTESGKRIKFYFLDDNPITKEADVRLNRTILLSTPVSVESLDGSMRYPLGHMYHQWFVVPLGMFVFSLVGILFRNRIEWCFNCSFVVGVSFIFYWVFV
jgi:curved DNA-binding protein CbpA